MAGCRPQALSHGLPRALTTSAIIALVLDSLAGPAFAGGSGHGGTGGWFDPNDPGGYHVRAGQPGRGSPHSAPKAGNNGTSDGGTGGDGCTVDGVLLVCPECADPANAGVCNASAAAPAISPAQLAQQKWNTLQLPLPDARTAPPRGTDGLTGLPEWVWVPSDEWRPLTQTASAGTVWARVTATPKQLRVKPGARMRAVSCAGPGTAYDPGQPASDQRTDCSYTYRQPSKSQPQSVYRMTVTVVWGGTWVGSDGSSGGLPDISRSTTFSLRVAEGQGLYE